MKWSKKWGAVCVERRKHGSGRGLCKPVVEIRKGSTFLLYYLGNGMMVSAGDPIKYANIHSSYWEKHLAGFGRLSK